MLLKNLRPTLLGIVALLLIYLYFFSLPTKEPHNQKKEIPILNTHNQEKEAFNYLNELREGAGLITFSSNTFLNKATKNHASYLINNLTYGHYEDSNKSDFTGEFAAKRVKYVGYDTELIIENVSSNNRNYKESIDGLFAAIYHRLAFLDFQGDEIGISIKQHSKHRIKTAFVYNIGSSAINKLYKNGKKPSKIELNNALNRYKRSNAKIVTYPFNQQTDIPPVFFNEMPDPLPNYDVSGFPISISFNQALFNSIEFLNFELFNSKGEHIRNTIIHTSKTDPNHRLNKFSFVLFPLDRLEWNSNYSVKFLAIVDKKIMEKKWSFTTRKHSIPLHKIEDESNTITVKVNEPNLFYFPPRTAKDLLHNVRYNSNFSMEFIDSNTLKLTALKSSLLTKHLRIGSHQLNLNIQD